MQERCALLNRITLIGNLGADPEMKTTQNGHPVCNLSVATKEKWKTKAGQAQERTEWHRVLVFGGQADACGQYLRKGSQVYLEGRVQTRKWTGQDGLQHTVVEVVATSVRFLGGTHEHRENSPADRGRRGAAPSNQASGGSPFSDPEIPW